MGERKSLCPRWRTKTRKVTASLGGQIDSVTRDTAEDDSTDKDTNFVKFSGKFTVPAGTSSVQKLGNINISATWSGVTDSLQGAYVTINKKVQISDGVLVQVTASQAETFPDNTLDDLSQPSYFPLCKGSLDFVVGDELIYKEGGTPTLTTTWPPVGVFIQKILPRWAALWKTM